MRFLEVPLQGPGRERLLTSEAPLHSGLCERTVLGPDGMAIARRTVNLQHLFRGTSLVKKAPPLRTRSVQRGLEMKDPHELQDLKREFKLPWRRAGLLKSS